MLHQAPNVLVDLSGVNRPCAPSMWYVGNDSLESYSLPPDTFPISPNDSEYLTAVKQVKLDGIRWHVNGNIVQVNFAVIGNAVLRTINDPNASVEDMDKLVLTTFESLTEWLAAVPEMPTNVTAEEIQHTMLISSAALCMKSVVSPYLMARCDDRRQATSVLPPQMCNGETRERMLADYISNACRLCRHMRLVTDLLENETPPMFISYALMLAGGIAAACTHSAPTRALRESFAQTTAFIKRMCKSCGTKSLLFAQAWEEIVQVEEMVTFMPKRLEKSQLLTMRDLLVPGSIEAAVDKKFTVFLHPIRHIANMPPAANSVFDDQPSEPRTRPHGGIPLTSNLCAIFGSKPVGAKIKRTASMEAATARSHQRQVPEYKMTYTSISSILVSLVVATMDEEFFAFLPELGGASEQMQVRVQPSPASTEGSLAGRVDTMRIHSMSPPMTQLSQSLPPLHHAVHSPPLPTASHQSAQTPTEAPQSPAPATHHHQSPPPPPSPEECSPAAKHSSGSRSNVINLLN
ncbi:hypothetical protein EC988_002971 [Linderina pennispora]|nr:hypothetical protein EC988_002971 [Linderina pennispora]